MAALLVLLLTFSSSAMVIPLLNRLRDALGISTGQAAWSTIAYFAGCAASLLFLGRISDRLGRRPVAAVVLVLVLGVLQLFPAITSYVQLLVLRAAQGIASGLTTSAVVAWVVDTSPPHRKTVGAALAGGGPSLGFAIGSIFTGLWTEALGWPLLNLLTLLEGLSVAGLLLLVFSQDSRARPDPSWRSLLVPRLIIPISVRPLFIPVMLTILAAWAFGAFLQGLSAPMAEYLFGQDDPLAASLIFSLFIVGGGSGGFLLRGETHRALRRCTLWYGASSVAVFISFAGGWYAMLLVLLIPTGMFSGLACAAAMKLLLGSLRAQDRAGVFASVYAIGYGGAVLIGWWSGWSVNTFGIVATGFCFCAWLAVLGFAALRLSRS